MVIQFSRPSWSMYRPRLESFPGGNVHPARYHHLRIAAFRARARYRGYRSRTNRYRDYIGTRNPVYWQNWRRTRQSYIQSSRLRDAYRNTPVGFSVGPYPTFGAPAA